MQRKLKKKTTISIDGDILNKFKVYCRERGMKLSPKVELFMMTELKEYEQKKEIPKRE